MDCTPKDNVVEEQVPVPAPSEYQPVVNVDTPLTDAKLMNSEGGVPSGKLFDFQCVGYFFWEGTVHPFASHYFSPIITNHHGWGS